MMLMKDIMITMPYMAFQKISKKYAKNPYVSGIAESLSQYNRFSPEERGWSFDQKKSYIL